MSRRAETTKHPALAKKGTSNQVEKSPLWENLHEDQQVFLSNYSATRDAYAAAKNGGFTQTWIDEQLEDSNFHVLMDTVSQAPVEFGVHMVKGMIPKTVLKLNDLLNSNNEKIQLDAIKHCHNVAKMTGNDGAPMGQQLNVQVNMFPMNGHDDRSD